MNKVITTLGLVSVLSLTGCNKTEEGASFGAGIGALAGQAIGGDTNATLIGAGVGALLGGAIGNDQQSQNNSYNQPNGVTQRRSTTRTILNPDGTTTTVGSETTESYKEDQGYQGLPQ